MDSLTIETKTDREEKGKEKKEKGKRREKGK